MFEEVTNKLTKYVCNNDGDKLANLFEENGIYHDYIYGSFKGKKNIKLMLNNYFHRDAKSFYWRMYDHVYKDNKGQTPIMSAVKQASNILNNKQTTKSYVGLLGNLGFIETTEKDIYKIF